MAAKKENSAEKKPKGRPATKKTAAVSAQPQGEITSKIEADTKSTNTKISDKIHTKITTKIFQPLNKGDLPFSIYPSITPSFITPL